MKYRLLPGLVLALGMLLVINSAGRAAGADRPNILWITCEDISPNLGCYGDTYAVTPNLDRFATQGVRYNAAFAPIGVCAPARSTLITGMYACSLGSQHMRCQVKLPASVYAFPWYLRQAGYYCTNNVKTDYNFQAEPTTWDESSRNAHWRKRPDKQTPFFGVFNFVTSHESQIRLPEDQYQARTKDFTAHERHDPARAPIPPYLPDTPEVRQDWARYYDMITFMDKQAGEVLRQLEEDGLADSTIVFFFSDHGAGMPRSKRWLYESSTRVPLIVRFPDRFKQLAPGAPGSTTDRLVNFVDFAPTVLSLTGVDIPATMQGSAFLGGHEAPPRQYVHGFRDRMDERTDMLRSIRDERYRYIHNYMPQLPWFGSQYIAYMYEMPTMRVWQELADAGKLTGPPAALMAPSKPTEELYDTQADPHEIHNLAGDPRFRPILERLRAEEKRWMRSILDLGLLPEADLRSRFGDASPYDAVRSDPASYPFDRILSAADLASRRDPDSLPTLVQLLHDPDPAIRFWASTGLGILGPRASSARPSLLSALTDSSPSVRLSSADALTRQGQFASALPTLSSSLTDPSEWVRLQAIQVADRLDVTQAKPLLPLLEQARHDSNQDIVKVAEHAVRAFETP